MQPAQNNSEKSGLILSLIERSLEKALKVSDSSEKAKIVPQTPPDPALAASLMPTVERDEDIDYIAFILGTLSAVIVGSAIGLVSPLLW